MARSTNNIITQGLSGKSGDLLVFRQRDGQTIVAQPARPTQKPVSEDQQATRDNFQQAVIYGRSAREDASTVQAYRDAAPANQTWWSMAIADFFNAPNIHTIDISGYTGRPGEPIKINVDDDFKVKAVKLSIHNEDGIQVEEGYAIQSGDSTEWIYTTTATNLSIAGDKITVTATDNPENVALGQLILR